MAELADALDLGSSGNTRAGSTPVIRTGQPPVNIIFTGGLLHNKKTLVNQFPFTRAFFPNLLLESSDPSS